MMADISNHIEFFFLDYVEYKSLDKLEDECSSEIQENTTFNVIPIHGFEICCSIDKQISMLLPNYKTLYSIDDQLLEEF